VSAVPAVPAARCENCGAPVSARYCSACDQRVLMLAITGIYGVLTL